MPLGKYTVVVVFSAVFLQLTSGQSSCESIGGECVEVISCISASNSIQKYGMHSLERCGWNGLMEKVCCLDRPQIRELPTSTEDDRSIWRDYDFTTPNYKTTKKSQVRGTIRKSEAACARYAAGVRWQVDWHILGGVNAEVGEFPHMVLLGYENIDDPSILDWKCAGSIISERFVLTAAHCVIRIQPIRALVGVLNITERSASRREYTIQNISVYPEYVRRQGKHDIALIKVSENVIFSDLVYPACLYQKSDDPLGLMITGWGKIFFGQDIRSETLQKARVVPVPLSSCNSTYLARLNRALNQGQVCAGPANPNIPTDSCPGDSGGPLQIELEGMYSIVGIISFGLTDCGGDAPSVYTRVSEYLDWIEGIVWS